MQRLLIIVLSTLLLFSCQNELSVENISTNLDSEFEALNDSQMIINHLARMNKIIFGPVISHVGFDPNFKGELSETKSMECPVTSKEVSEIRREIEEQEFSEFTLEFIPNCEIGANPIPYEGTLAISLFGKIWEEEGRMEVTFLEGFTAKQGISENGEPINLIFESGQINYDFIDFQDNELSFDTEVVDLIAEEVSERNNLRFILVALEDAVTTVNLGEMPNDLDEPVTFLDDIANISFSSGLLKRTERNDQGVESDRADAILHSSSLDFSVLCGCPIGGSLNLNISVNAFSVDYTPKLENCAANPLVSIETNGTPVLSDAPDIDTFLPCDGF